MKKILYLAFAMLALCLTNKQSQAQTISSHTETADSSACGRFIFNYTITGCTGSSLTMTVNFGDGTSVTDTMSCFSGSASTMLVHAYATSGTYTVKSVLFDGTTAVDSVSYSLAVAYCRNVMINAFLDGNSNCIKETTEPPLYAPTSIAVDSAGVPIDTISIASGLIYKAYGPIGTVYGFRVATPPAGMVHTCPSSGVVYATLTPPSTTIPPLSLGFECATSSSYDLSLTAAFTPAIAGGGANRANIVVSNTNCSGTGGTNAIVTFHYSPKYTFDALYGGYTYTVTGTSVAVNVGTVTPATPKHILVRLTPVSALTVGDTVNSMFSVTPVTGDVDLTNNTVIRNDIIRGSYDPNAKGVTPSGYISAGTRLEYMLEFENDGTDTAYNIHIMDTLSDDLDINTLRMVGSTHKVNLLKYVDAGRNILKFDFPNILLPDSTHHNYCRGSVTFSIEAKNTLPPGTIIENRVGIYFDTNPVVMTNSVYSEIPMPTAVANTHVSAVELYPNPVSETLHIASVAGAYSSLHIYNIMGQLVGKQTITQGDVQVDVSELLPGIYYVSLHGKNDTKTIKFEKL